MTHSYAMQERPEKRAERLRAERGTVRCALCRWQATGSMLRVMERAKAHRARAHPEAPVESNARWHNEPPRGRQAPAPIVPPEAPVEPTFRERVVARLRERGESSAAEVAADLGERTGSVSSAFGWALRTGLVVARSSRGSTAKLWRVAGAEPGADLEAERVPDVCEALEASGGPMTIDEVAAATGRPKGSVATALAGAVRHGRAERVGRGLYRAIT